jgi:peptidyl-prolyl cis-trans isomerase C
MKISHVLALLAAGILCFSVVVKAESNSSAKAAEPNSKVIATVNGKDITQAQLDEKIGPRLKQMAAHVPADQLDKVKKQFESKALENMVIVTLLDEQVKDKGIKVSDEELDKTFADQLRANQMSEQDLEKYLASYGMTIAQAKEQMKKSIGYQKLIDSQITGKADVNDAAAKKFYQDNADEFKQPEKVRASHILISTRSTDPNADPNKVKKEAKAKAEEILAQLKKGADFNDLAKKSDDPGSKMQGGDLGYFPRGMMVKQFEDTAFALKPGQMSGLVESPFGYHIIKVTGHQDPNTESFEQAKPQIKERLAMEKKQELGKKYVDDLTKSAKITYAPGMEPNSMVIGAKPIAPAEPKKP